MLRRFRRVSMAATIVVLCPLALLSAPSREPVPASEWQAFQKSVQPFFVKHCYECHTDKMSGDVRLDQFPNDKALAEGLPTFVKIQDVLRTHAMPPRKRPRPATTKSSRCSPGWKVSFRTMKQRPWLDRIAH